MQLLCAAFAGCVLSACSSEQAAGSQDPRPKAKEHVNRLAEETSPYLLQHRHNPVDWYPWGEAALRQAKEEDKPIFLSIGYAACHWCHVMERESFENPEIAKLMNQWFVCIKVDREERPDLDEIYMAATQAMTGHGGWPMSVFMTPDLEPFFCGTYYPPEDRMGMPGFPRVLEHVHELWADKRDEVEQHADRVTEYLKNSLAPKPDPGDPKLESIDRVVAQSASRHDPEHGGFGQEPRFAPKFPHASELSLLLRHHARTGDRESLEIAEHTLRRMAEGGIYDQLGGGFHRYSVDREWLVPHFEKMLYDNTLLAQTYAEAWLLTGDPLYERVLRETLDYLLREMQDDRGGFWSTTDADSEGVEGKFFVWSEDEIDRVCGDDAKAFALRYGVSAGGNWEGHNILHVAQSIDEVARALELEPGEVEERIARCKAKLFEVRKARVPPGLDDKVLAAWNGMAIAAFAVGHQTLGDARYLRAAQRAAGFVLDSMREEGRLLRTWRKGDARLTGYLEDYAFVADGLLHLFESDFDPRWLREARTLLAQMHEHYFDETDGSFFFTADDHERLIARTKSVTESSQPSGIAMAAIAHLRGGLLLADEEVYARGLGVLRANHEFVQNYGVACTGLMLAVDFALSDPRELVVAGAPDAAATRAFVEAAWRTFPPHHVVVRVDANSRETLATLTELVAGKQPVDGAPAAYVCRRGVCDAPVTDPALLRLSR